DARGHRPTVGARPTRVRWAVPAPTPRTVTTNRRARHRPRMHPRRAVACARGRTGPACSGTAQHDRVAPADRGPVTGAIDPADREPHATARDRDAQRAAGRRADAAEGRPVDAAPDLDGAHP